MQPEENALGREGGLAKKGEVVGELECRVMVVERRRRLAEEEEEEEEEEQWWDEEEKNE